MSGSGRKALPDVWEWLGRRLKCSGVFGGPPVCPVVLGRPSWMSGSIREALPYVR